MPVTFQSRATCRGQWVVVGRPSDDSTTMPRHTCARNSATAVALATTTALRRSTYARHDASPRTNQVGVATIIENAFI